MTQTWRPDPKVKVEVAGTTVSDESLIVEVTRPLNNVSSAVLSVSDYQSKNYVGVINALDTLDISFRYGSASWTKVFSGIISTVSPQLSLQGEILVVSAWGLGNALAKTHCNTSYGKESQNSTIDTPTEIWTDLKDNYINKSFGGVATGYGITLSAVGGTSPTITYLKSPYKSNFDILNLTMDLITANQAGSASHQWFVDTAGALRIRPINNNTDANWREYWNGSQADSKITVKKDMILYDFRKNIEEYANNILLLSDLRKPGEDYWTEDSGGASLWGTAGHASTAVSDSNARYVVGSHSLRIFCNASQSGRAFYPSAENAAWDITKIESEQSVPLLNFYIWRNGYVLNTSQIRLFTTDNDTDYFYVALSTLLGSSITTWTHRSIPIGTYYKTLAEQRYYRWSTNGSPNWNDINGFAFRINVSASGWGETFIDDLHLSGKIVREAKDTSEISANDEYQKIIRNDTAINDSLTASDDSGVAGQLAYAELLRRSQTPIVGLIKIPGAVDILPGQKIYVEACQQSGGSYRIDDDFRVVELKHLFTPEGFTTTLNLTDDVTNSHAFGVPTQWSILKEYAGALGHAEAKNLKGSGVDILIPVLSNSY